MATLDVFNEWSRICSGWINADRYCFGELLLQIRQSYSGRISNRLIVLRSSKNTVYLVSGHRRLVVLRQLQWHPVPCIAQRLLEHWSMWTTCCSSFSSPWLMHLPLATRTRSRSTGFVSKWWLNIPTGRAELRLRQASVPALSFFETVPGARIWLISPQQSEGQMSLKDVNI